MTNVDTGCTPNHIIFLPPKTKAGLSSVVRKKVVPAKKNILTAVQVVHSVKASRSVSNCFVFVSYDPACLSLGCSNAPCSLPPSLPSGHRSVVRKKVLAEEEPNCDWALTWWALADIPEPATPKGEFRMSYNTKQAIYYGEVRQAPAERLCSDIWSPLPF